MYSNQKWFLCEGLESLHAIVLQAQGAHLPWGLLARLSCLHTCTRTNTLLYFCFSALMCQSMRGSFAYSDSISNAHALTERMLDADQGLLNHLQAASFYSAAWTCSLSSICNKAKTSNLKSLTKLRRWEGLDLRLSSGYINLLIVEFDPSAATRRSAVNWTSFEPEDSTEASAVMIRLPADCL